VSGATLTTDRFGHANKAYSFDGISNYIDLAKLLPDQTSLSISVWIKPTGNVSTQGFILFDGNSQCGNDLALLFTNNTIKLVAQKSGAVLDGSVQTSLPSTSFNNWYHIVWTMSPSQSKVFINGALSNTINSSGSNVGYHYTPTIGSMFDGNTAPCGSPRSAFFEGGIDDIRVYNRTLSLTEVNRLYNFTYTGVSKLDNESTQINIYPNPSQGLLNIESNGKSGQSMKVDFYDLMGRNVKQLDIPRPNSTIDVSDLNSGIYSVIIKIGDMMKVQKIILSK
ncbi:MAG: LamG-like jellyroll fold domain-containing protein, partial [Bacteroidia bacterium]